ncbi:MAG: type I-C CRISPR-associated protein Cas7/Csd2 [Desulfobacteraceae bacterium]|nr:MAG: type I-C CRISPR-associated protein Cas7/Csd2 [Desulfobacteraceae bacterium]
MGEPIKNRYDFVLFFDVKDGNPNGDPDAGNLPRIDAETGMGLVTDVCLKRKVRNYVQLTKSQNGPPETGYEIYIKEKAVLGREHVRAFRELQIPLGEESRNEVPGSYLDALQEFSLPEGMSSIPGDEDKNYIVVAADADVKAVKEELKGLLKESQLSSEIKKFLESCLKGVKARKPKAEDVKKGRKWMCENFFDVRTFGAVMMLKSAPNCGQVRGPIQLTFARSVEPVVALEHSITRMAVATEAEAERQQGDNRTMGRKFTVPYGLYRAHGFISPHLAAQTGFNQDDLNLFWDALLGMFDHDRSAARGLMSTRRLVVFKHETALGQKPANQLFERVTWKRTTNGPAREFSDYEIQLDGQAISATLKNVDVEPS